MLLIGVCLLSALLFAAGNSLQHVGANNLGGTDLPPLKIAWRLARNKVWLLGSAIAMAAFATHVVALGLGNVGVVQPLLLVGVILAICFRPLLDGARAHVKELGGAVVAVAGLALYIRAGAIYDAESGDPASSSLVVTLTAVGAVAVLLAVARRLHLNLSLTFGLCAGLLMGTGAGLFKQILESDGLHDQLLGWQLPTALALEIAGTFLNQRAYHTGPLSGSMPVLNVASVLMGGLFGALVFGQLPSLDPGSVAGQLGGIGLAGLGLIVLVRHQADTAPQLVSVPSDKVESTDEVESTDDVDADPDGDPGFQASYA